METQEELDARKRQEEEEQEKSRVSQKAYHQHRFRTAKTSLGKLYHKQKQKKYASRYRALLPDPDVVFKEGMKQSRISKETLAAISIHLAPLEQKYKAVLAIVGGKKSLNLPEGTNPAETLTILIQNYAADLREQQHSVEL